MARDIRQHALACAAYRWQGTNRQQATDATVIDTAREFEAYLRGRTADDVVDAILAELSDRSGFDGWWQGIDLDVRVEIGHALRRIIEGTS